VLAALLAVTVTTVSPSFVHENVAVDEYCPYSGVGDHVYVIGEVALFGLTVAVKLSVLYRIPKLVLVIATLLIGITGPAMTIE
jgi:hypothetical protein